MGPLLVFFVLCASPAVPHLAKGKEHRPTLLPPLSSCSCCCPLTGRGVNVNVTHLCHSDKHFRARYLYTVECICNYVVRYFFFFSGDCSSRFSGCARTMLRFVLRRHALASRNSPISLQICTEEMHQTLLRDSVSGMPVRMWDSHYVFFFFFLDAGTVRALTQQQTSLSGVAS